MRKAVVLSVLLLLALVVTQALAPQPAPLTRHVNNVDPTCGGHLPCYATIQAAVDAVQPGETVRIQAGVYPETLVLSDKNTFPGASEADRITIEADPTAPAGSVVLGSSKAGDCLPGVGSTSNPSSFSPCAG